MSVSMLRRLSRAVEADDTRDRWPARRLVPIGRALYHFGAGSCSLESHTWKGRVPFSNASERREGL